MNHPGFPPDFELEIAGVGVFPNGSTTELTADQEQAYIIRNNSMLSDDVADGGNMAVTGTPLISSVEEGLDTVGAAEAPAAVEAPAAEVPAEEVTAETTAETTTKNSTK
jgi:hypothetical protein